MTSHAFAITLSDRLVRFARSVARRARLRPAPHLAAVAVHNERIFPAHAASEAHSAAYHASSWVYVAVNRIAEAGALVPLRIVPRTPSSPETDSASIVPPDAAAPERAQRHPLDALLDSPNPYTSRFELLEQTLGSLELTGNAFWLLAGDSAGVPREIWLLRPDRVSIVPDATRYVRGYLYEIDGQRIPLERVEVVHFRRWHPLNDYYGFSALDAARLAVQSDRAMAQWNANTFGMDNGVPAGIVTVRDMVSDADFDRIKREWRASYGAGQRRTAFLRGTGVTWQHIGLSHHDLDFLKGRTWHRDEILNIFGIPIGLLSDNATEANAKVAERQFIERTLYPKLVRLAQKITQELLPFWGDGWLAQFDDIRPTDTQARLDEIRVAYPILSINELRGRYFGLSPVAWGDAPAVGTHAAAPANTDRVLPAAPSLSPNTPSGAADPASADDAAPAAPSTERGDTPVKAATDALTPADELAAWERFALNRLHRQTSTDQPLTRGRAFTVRALAPDVADAVRVALSDAATPDAVRAVFARARAAL